MPREKWMPVSDWVGYYEVSDLGRVKSLGRLDRLGRLVPERILSPGIHPDGYRVVAFYGDGRKKPNQYVHRLVAVAFLGDPKPGQIVCHNNGVPSDNRAENLRWDTTSGNFYDKRKHGTDHKVNRTHCPRNHPLSGSNLVLGRRDTGRRGCRSCAATSAWFQRHPNVDRNLFDDIAATYLWKFSAKRPKEAAA